MKKMLGYLLLASAELAFIAGIVVGACLLYGGK